MTTPVGELDAELYPMNQDRVDFSRLMYANSIDFIAGYVTRHGIDEEAALAMIERDVRQMLDQRRKPQ